MDTNNTLKDRKKELIGDILPFVIVFIVTIFVYKYIILIGPVASGSMEKTLMTKDICVFNRLAYVFSEPQRGDIIVFNHYGQEWLKRVIGVAGDEITFENGYVFVNGMQLVEDYLEEGIETNCTKSFTVPEGCVFVMGDNRGDSYDSRYWDNPYVSVDDILGKIMIDFGHFGE